MGDRAAESLAVAESKLAVMCHELDIFVAPDSSLERRILELRVVVSDLRARLLVLQTGGATTGPVARFVDEVEAVEKRLIAVTCGPDCA